MTPTRRSQSPSPSAANDSNEQAARAPPTPLRSFPTGLSPATSAGTSGNRAKALAKATSANLDAMQSPLHGVDSELYRSIQTHNDEQDDSVVDDEASSQEALRDTLNFENTPSRKRGRELDEGYDDDEDAAETKADDLTFATDLTTEDELTTPTLDNNTSSPTPKSNSASGGKQKLPIRKKCTAQIIKKKRKSVMFDASMNKVTTYIEDEPLGRKKNERELRAERRETKAREEARAKRRKRVEDEEE